MRISSSSLRSELLARWRFSAHCSRHACTGLFWRTCSAQLRHLAAIFVYSSFKCRLAVDTSKNGAKGILFSYLLIELYFLPDKSQIQTSYSYILERVMNLPHTLFICFVADTRFMVTHMRYNFFFFNVESNLKWCCTVSMVITWPTSQGSRLFVSVTVTTRFVWVTRGLDNNYLRLPLGLSHLDSSAGATFTSVRTKMLKWLFPLPRLVSLKDISALLKWWGLVDRAPIHAAPLRPWQSLISASKTKDPARFKRVDLRQTKANLGSRMAKYPATAETSTRRGQQGQSQNWLSVSGDIYDVWVPEQGWLSWLTALIWGVIQSLGAYTHTGFDAIYCYGMWPHSKARCRDWIVLFAAHLCVCQAGLIACWPRFQSGRFFCLFFPQKYIFRGRGDFTS